MREAGGDLNFQKSVGGIDQDDGAAGGAHEPDGFAQNEVEGFLLVEGRMEDVADLVEEVEPLIALFKFSQFVVHGSNLNKSTHLRIKISFRRRPGGSPHAHGHQDSRAAEEKIGKPGGDEGR